jgi:hypothetical protein
LGRFNYSKVRKSLPFAARVGQGAQVVNKRAVTFFRKDPTEDLQLTWRLSLTIEVTKSPTTKFTVHSSGKRQNTRVPLSVIDNGGKEAHNE